MYASKSARNTWLDTDTQSKGAASRLMRRVGQLERHRLLWSAAHDLSQLGAGGRIAAEADISDVSPIELKLITNGP